LRRVAAITALVVGTIALCGGCFMPPVVMQAHDAEWTLADSKYPRSGRIVEVATEDPVLRGLYVPSDPGAPLVVHFAEAGASVTFGPALRDQYLDLAQRGFASLAVDYRGVGLSDGATDTGELPTDVDAIYAHALRLVDGDPSRLVLRGTSLGTMAIAHLLAQGHQPAAVCLYAPVFADSVVMAFGYAVYNDFLVALAWPFLRSVPLPRLTDALSTYRGALFVLGHPSDELLTDREFAELAEAVDARGGTLVTTTRGLSVGHSHPVLRHLTQHVRLTVLSLDVTREEAGFLETAFPGVPDVERRVRTALADGDQTLADAVRAAPDAMARLRELAGRSLGAADHLLACALQLREPGLSAMLLTNEARASGQTLLSRHRGAPLLGVLDLDDPAGRIEDIALVAACQQLGFMFPREAPDENHLRRVLALCRCLSAHFEGVAMPAVGPGDATDFSIENGMVHWREGERARFMALLIPEPSVGGQVDRRRHLARIACKAAGFVDRVVPASEPPRIEVRGVDGTWTVDCESLTIR